MKAFCAVAAVGLAMAVPAGSAVAQYGYGGGGYGYQEPAYGYRGGGGGGGFDEQAYLACNPDVRRAVRRGQFNSGFQHYRSYGRREGRRLDC